MPAIHLLARHAHSRRRLLNTLNTTRGSDRRKSDDTRNVADGNEELALSARAIPPWPDCTCILSLKLDHLNRTTVTCLLAIASVEWVAQGTAAPCPMGLDGD